MKRLVLLTLLLAMSSVARADEFDSITLVRDDVDPGIAITVRADGRATYESNPFRDANEHRFVEGKLSSATLDRIAQAIASANLPALASPSHRVLRQTFELQATIRGRNVTVGDAGRFRVRLAPLVNELRAAARGLDDPAPPRAAPVAGASFKLSVVNFCVQRVIEVDAKGAVRVTDARDSSTPRRRGTATREQLDGLARALGESGIFSAGGPRAFSSELECAHSEELQVTVLNAAGGGRTENLTRVCRYGRGVAAVAERLEEIARTANDPSDAAPRAPVGTGESSSWVWIDEKGAVNANGKEGQAYGQATEAELALLNPAIRALERRLEEKRRAPVETESSAPRGTTAEGGVGSAGPPPGDDEDPEGRPARRRAERIPEGRRVTLRDEEVEDELGTVRALVRSIGDRVLREGRTLPGYRHDSDRREDEPAKERWRPDLDVRLRARTLRQGRAVVVHEEVFLQKDGNVLASTKVDGTQELDHVKGRATPAEIARVNELLAAAKPDPSGYGLEPPVNLSKPDSVWEGVWWQDGNLGATGSPERLGTLHLLADELRAIAARLRRERDAAKPPVAAHPAPKPAPKPPTVGLSGALGRTR